MIADDLLIANEDEESHDEVLRLVIKRPKDKNVRFNFKKLQFKKSAVVYLMCILVRTVSSLTPLKFGQFSRYRIPQILMLSSVLWICLTSCLPSFRISRLSLPRSAHCWDLEYHGTGVLRSTRQCSRLRTYCPVSQYLRCLTQPFQLRCRLMSLLLAWVHV